LEALIRAYACGSNACREVWVADLSARALLLRIVRQTAGRGGLLPDPDCEDVVQEVLLKLSVQSRRILASLPEDPREAGSYLAALAANLCRDILRARSTLKRRGGLHPSLEEVDADPNQAAMDLVVESRLLRAQVEKTLESGRDRFVFRLYYRWGFTAAEIAALSSIGLSAKGVESLLYRVTLQARDQLNPPRNAGAGEP
jgi:RNA polymerase sigma factor (sigma-70 family)